MAGIRYPPSSHLGNYKYEREGVFTVLNPGIPRFLDPLADTGQSHTKAEMYLQPRLRNTSGSLLHFLTSPKELGRSQLSSFISQMLYSDFFPLTCSSITGCLSSFILPWLPPRDSFLSFLSPGFNHSPSQSRLMKALFSLYKPSV